MKRTRLKSNARRLAGRMFYPITQTWEGEQRAFVKQRSEEIVLAFAARIEVTPHLYDPEVCTQRVGSAGVIIEALPHGWMLVCDEWTDDLVRKRPRYNRYRMRGLCVKLKVPFWDAMNVDEMKAVIVRWAIHEQVPEIIF